MKSHQIADPLLLRKRIPYITIVLGICSAWLSGCQCKQYIDDQIAYCEPIDDACAGWHARYHAYKAWKQFGQVCTEGDPHRCYYKDGFYDGFINVATGGDGCLPAMPPRKYWKTCYDNPAGQLKICAYFQGYPQGVQAAYEMGLASRGRLSTSLPPYLKNGNAGCRTCPGSHGHPMIYDSEQFSPVPDRMIPAVPPVPGNMDFGSGLGPVLPDVSNADDLNLVAPPLPFGRGANEGI